jgi:hypothetical protein
MHSFIIWSCFCIAALDMSLAEAVPPANIIKPYVSVANNLLIISPGCCGESHCSPTPSGLKTNSLRAKEDQTVGIRLLSRAIEEPLRQIVENAGEDAAVVLNAVKAGKGAYGWAVPGATALP